MTKRIQIKTYNVPHELCFDNFSYECEIKLTYQSIDEPYFYPQPIGLIYFDKNIDDFNFKSTYKVEKLNE